MANEDLGTLRYGIEVDTKGVDKGQEAMDGLQKSADETGKSVDGAGKSATASSKKIKNLGDASEKTAKQSDGMSKSVKAAAAALATYLTIDAAKEIIKTADSFQLLNDRIRLATDATGDYVTVQKELYALSQSTGTALSGNVDLFQRIQIGASELGRSNSEVLQLVESLSKLGTLGGSSSEELSNATVQLAQGLAGGIIRAEEFNSILENTPKIAQAIAEGLGVSVGELRAMMLKGELLADDVFNSILSQTQKVNEEFDKMPARIGRSGTALSNAWTNTVGLFDDAIGASSTIAGWMDAIADKLDERVDFWREELGLVEQMEIQVSSLEAAYRGLGLVQLEARKATLERMESDLAERVKEIENNIIDLPMDDVIRQNYAAVNAELEEVRKQINELTGDQKKGGDDVKKALDDLISKYNPLIAEEKELIDQQKLLNSELKKAHADEVPLITNALIAVGKQLDVVRDKMKEVNTTAANGEFQALIGNLPNNLPATTQGEPIVVSEIVDGAKEGLKAVPSDFAMSVGNALASQDFSSFGNILASQAAGSIGTAVTDAVGGSLGGVAGGLVGGAAGAVISQAISDYMADDLIALERQASQGTGTVLGSIDAKSQSIANSLDYMTEGLDDLIGVNTDGFKAMQALVDSIGGASNLVARDFDASGIATGLGLSGLGSITQDFGGIVDDFFGGLTGGLFEDVFGGIGGALFGSSSVSDQGINLLSGTIAELIENDVAQAYQTVTKKSLFSSSRSENYRFAGDAIEQQFDLTLEAMRDAVTTSAESLGMLPSEIQANLDAFTIEAQKISIKDLSAEEVADELEAVFSSIFDNLSSAVVPYVDDFQQAGEGAGETLSRLSTNLSVVDEMLAQLRLGELQGTTQEMLTLSEGVVDFFGDASSLAGALTGFVDEFATQERQLEILTGNLTEALGEQDVAILSSRDGVYDYIASLEQLDGDNVERIANILSLTDSMDEYFDLLESVTESVADYTDLQIRLAEAQDNEDLVTQLTREQELANAIDDTARGLLNSIYAAEELANANNQLAGLELRLAEARGNNGLVEAINLQNELDSALTDEAKSMIIAIQAAEKMTLINSEVEDLELRLAEARNNTDLVTLINRENERSDALSDAALAMLDDIYAIEDAQRRLEDATSATDTAFSVLTKSIQSEIDNLTDSYDAQRKALSDAADAGAESISTLSSVTSMLKSALGSVSTSVSPLSAASRLSSARSQLSNFADSGVLPSENVLEGLLDTVTGSNEQYYASAEDYYREQGRTANDIALLSQLADGQLTEAEKAQKVASDQLDILEDQYDFERSALESQLERWETQIEISRNTYLETVEVTRAVESLAAAIFREGQASSELSDSGYMIPAFANGGTFSQGGLALVGERGPEIVNMPAGTHVSTAQQTASMLNNNRMIELMQEMIDRTIVQNGYAKRSYDILNRVSNGGNAFSTDTVVVASV